MKKEERTLADELVDLLIENKEGKAVTYKELDDALNKVRGKILQKLLDTYEI